MRRIPDLDHAGLGQPVKDSADRFDGGPKQIRDIRPWQQHGQNSGAVRKRLIGHEFAGQREESAEPFLGPPRGKRPGQPVQAIKLNLLLVEEFSPQTIVLIDQHIELAPVNSAQPALRRGFDT